MKIFKTFILSIAVLLSSCSKDVKTKEVEKPKVECKEEKYAKAGDLGGQIFSCKFKEFSISSYKMPAMENKEYLTKVYDWFKSNIFFGPEIHTFQGILFNGDSSKSNALGAYDPNYKFIELFPNNIDGSMEYVVPYNIAQRFGEETLDPKTDYRYWLYTISHEYNHHSTIAISTQKLVERNFGGDVVNDIEINKKGEKFLSLYGVDQSHGYKDYNKVNPIPPGTGGTSKVFWPTTYYPTSFNKYLWSKPELLTRALGLYTYPAPKELQNENSVNAYGGIINDYWWFAHYNLNIYQTHKDEEGKPIQKPVDEALNKWAEFMDNEWYNDDGEFGEIFTTHDGQIFLSHNAKVHKFKLEDIKNSENTIDFANVEKIDNLKYYWRPFDSRKSRKISLESNVAKSSAKILPNKTYKLIYNGKHLQEAFDLKKDESKVMLWSKKIPIILYKGKEGLYLTSEDTSLWV